MSLRRFLAALASGCPMETPELASRAPGRVHTGPARVPHPEPSTRRPVDKPTRVHVDGSARRDRWTYRPEAEGYVLDGLPSLDWKGRPAGIRLDTIEEQWPINADTVRYLAGWAGQRDYQLVASAAPHLGLTTNGGRLLAPGERS